MVANDVRISYWSSDVCSSDLVRHFVAPEFSRQRCALPTIRRSAGYGRLAALWSGRAVWHRSRALRASVVGVRRGLVKDRLFGGVPIAVCQFGDFRKRARSIFWFAAAHHHCDVLAQLAVVILGWRYATACAREHDDWTSVGQGRGVPAG